MDALLAYLGICIAVAALLAYALCKSAKAHTSATVDLVEAWADDLIADLEAKRAAQPVAPGQTSTKANHEIPD